MCALIEQDRCAPRPEGRVAPAFVHIIYVPHQLSFLIKMKLLNELLPSVNSKHIYDVNNHQSWLFLLNVFFFRKPANSKQGLKAVGSTLTSLCSCNQTLLEIFIELTILSNQQRQKHAKTNHCDLRSGEAAYI